MAEQQLEVAEGRIKKCNNCNILRKQWPVVFPYKFVAAVSR